MSRDKQIEEMAKEICSEYDCVIPCQSCAYYRYENCRDVKSAEKLYNAGYRKSTDLAEEIFADIHNMLLKVIGVVDEGLDRSIRNDNEEAIKIHVGALETLKCLIPIFAELKKKYIGKDTNVTTKTEEVE